MKVSVLLAAYNERSALPELLDELSRVAHLQNIPIEVTIVDDGSTDGTRSFLRNKLQKKEKLTSQEDYFKGEYDFHGDIDHKVLTVTVLCHDKNRGLGYSLRTGFDYLMPRLDDDDVIITMDADNTHSSKLFPLLITEMKRGVDVVIASRFAESGRTVGLSVYRRFLSWVARRLMSLLIPLPGVRDYTCGYRAYRLKMLRKAKMINVMTQSGFSIQLEILLHLSSKGARFAEVPLELRYDKKEGPSKLKVLSTIISTLKILLQYSGAKKNRNEGNGHA